MNNLFVAKNLEVRKTTKFLKKTSDGVVKTMSQRVSEYQDTANKRCWI